MTNAVVSIQGQRKSSPLAPGVQCRGSIHVAFDGIVAQEVIGGVLYWIAYLTCEACGTKRTTRYYPKTNMKASPHKYYHSDDYPLDRTKEECQIEWLSSKVVEPQHGTENDRS